MNAFSIISISLWLGVAGFATYFFGLLGKLSPVVAICIVLALLIKITYHIRPIILAMQSCNHVEKSLLAMIGLQLTIHSLGLFVPETAFDALWYHLPEAAVYSSTGSIKKIPELIYSTMPRLGEMYLTLAMFAKSTFILKFVSFLIAVCYLLISYHLSRLFLSRTHSLLVVVVLTSFPLIGWQATSSYIDLTRALFELSSLYCLLKFITTSGVARNESVEYPPRLTWIIYSALLTGFALSTKIHSLIHLFAMTILIIFSLKLKKTYIKNHILLSMSFLLMTLLIASPWYLDNYLNSGHPFYPLNLEEKRLDQLNHAGAASVSEWVSGQIQRLPLIPVSLSHPRQQLSPIILLLFPLCIWQIKKIYFSTFPLIPYLFIAVVLWHFIPPPESRYLLGSLPILVILLLRALTTLQDKYVAIKQVAMLAIVMSVLLTTSIRLAASAKYFPLFTGQITREQYIESQTTDFNRDIIEKYYSGFWHNYSYP